MKTLMSDRKLSNVWSLVLAAETLPEHSTSRLINILKELGFRASLYDPQLLMLHKKGTLVLAITVHVLSKMAGLKSEIDSLVKTLEGHFGKLTYQESEFTNCGICHKRLPDGTITLDQSEYLSALKPINPKHYANLQKDALCPEHLRALYWSLLGAVAYSALTQAWVLVYIISPPTCNPEPHCYTCKKTKRTHPWAPASSPEIGV